MRCAIWYPLKPAALLKITLPHGFISRFFKLYKWYQIVHNITYYRGVIVQMRIRNREEEIIQRNIKQMRPRVKPYNFGDCFTRAEIIFDIYSSLPAVIVFC